MRYVKAELTREGTFSDPTAYLEKLPTLAASLPAGARAFATDPEHYNYGGLRCVKDLKPQTLTSGDDESWLELSFRHNCWKHDDDLTIRYNGVSHLTMDPSGEVAQLQDVMLDEILPDEQGCKHEIACISGSLIITCKDLSATWTPSNCSESEQPGCVRGG